LWHKSGFNGVYFNSYRFIDYGMNGHYWSKLRTVRVFEAYIVHVLDFSRVFVTLICYQTKVAHVKKTHLNYLRFSPSMCRLYFSL